MTSLFENITLPPSSDDVETLATMQAIHFALDLGLIDVILEGDSQVVISALKTVDVSMASFGNLLESVKLSINAFNCISFFHTLKLSNYITTLRVSIRVSMSGSCRVKMRAFN